MPGIVDGQRDGGDQQLISTNGTSNSSANNYEFWSKCRDDVNINQLEKFWSELSSQARQDLLRIDRQTLFEQARKNMYCSRCNGLLPEGFMQIVLHAKSLQHEGGGGKLSIEKLRISKRYLHGGPDDPSVCQDETKSPLFHPWGGLIATRDGALTLLDCYLHSKSFRGLQNVFDSARARERERELLYPDACGGGGRGWISQGIASYGTAHGFRETCTLHTAKLPCGTLVNFWSALGEETCQSLLRMKEEDFIERLMYRFDSKRFCRDCRRNVIRQFKELKELKRMRKELWCTSWFCVADTAFQCEVSNNTVYADWHQTFIDSIGTYRCFEWAVGSGEGKSDVLEYQNVGMDECARKNDLDLTDLSVCYITLRAWKKDGSCSDVSVRAHALKGRQCVHCRLVVGDGYVSITRGESIRKLFEHAEEAEEEEDDDAIDRDGNDLDGECSRTQKHAKSPELAREFLLDAATIIFKEQVEKAYREGTARQNAHSTFVYLALKLLEERIHVASKEIMTLEKQMKLLEEEEKEKQEEEERKERKRTKEKAKKLRRKERQREKDKKCSEASESPLLLDVSEEMPTSCIDDESYSCNRDSVSDTGVTNISESASTRVLDESSVNDYAVTESLAHAFDGVDGKFTDLKGGGGMFMVGGLEGTRRKWADRRRSAENGVVPYKSEPRYYDEFSEANCFGTQSSANATKLSSRNGGSRFGQKVHCSSMRATNRSELLFSDCDQQKEFRAKVEPQSSFGRFGCEGRLATKSDLSKTAHRITKFNQADCTRDNCGRARGKISNYASALCRDSPYTKQVWEPVEPHKRSSQSNSVSDVTLKSHLKTDDIESDKMMAEVCSNQISRELPQDSLGNITSSKNNGFHAFYQGKEAGEEDIYSSPGSCNLNKVTVFSHSSSSDNCLSCLSEGDTNTASPSHPNLESSSTSDSEDSSQQSDARQISDCPQNHAFNDDEVGNDRVVDNIGKGASNSACSASTFSQNVGILNSGLFSATSYVDNAENVKIVVGDVTSIQQRVLPSIPSQNFTYPNPVSWSAAPSSGLMTYPYPNPYLLPNPFSYSFPGGSPLCRQFGPVEHLATPFMNSNQIPVYQPVPAPNYLNLQSQSCVFEANNGVKVPFGETKIENVAMGGHLPTEVPFKDGIQKANLAKVDAGNAGFSLFHYGGPMALPTYGSSIQSSDNGEGSFPLNVDRVCGKKESPIKEYNLFGGMQFSLL